MKHAVHPVIELPWILIGMMSLCLGGILSVNLTIPIVTFCSQFLSVCKESTILLNIAILLLVPSL